MQRTYKLDGRYEQEGSGLLTGAPVVRVSGNRPEMKNNGFNVYSGMENFTLPGLYAMFPHEERALRQGDVILKYDDGKQMAVWLWGDCDTARYSPS